MISNSIDRDRDAITASMMAQGGFVNPSPVGTPIGSIPASAITDEMAAPPPPSVTSPRMSDLTVGGDLFGDVIESSLNDPNMGLFEAGGGMTGRSGGWGPSPSTAPGSGYNQGTPPGERSPSGYWGDFITDVP